MGALKLKIKGLNGLMVSEINKEPGASNEEIDRSDTEAVNTSSGEGSPLKAIEQPKINPQRKDKSPEKSIEPIKINTQRGETSIIKPIEPIKINTQKLVKSTTKSLNNLEKPIEPLKIKTPPVTNEIKVRKSVIVNTRGRGRPRKGLVPKLKIISPTVSSSIPTITKDNQNVDTSDIKGLVPKLKIISPTVSSSITTITKDNQNEDASDIKNSSEVRSNSAPVNNVWSICDAADQKAESSENSTKVHKYKNILIIIVSTS